MTNQESFESFLNEHFKQRLLFSSKRPKRDLSVSGAMYFIQETKIINHELHYIITQSSYYPKGLISQSSLLALMKQHSQDNPMMAHEIEMSRVGFYLGSTRCRCCDKNLGNGGGHVIFQYNNEKYFLTLTGGADHYLEHGIHLNLISYSFIDKEKGIKLHTQFVGDVQDLEKINSYLSHLEPILKLKNKHLKP